jgi:hypothetical protein
MGTPARSNNDEALYTCIYCSRLLEKEAFNREHVLSDAFGRYTNALVLHHCVCKDCNTYFSSLERFFARDSFEAVLRYARGVRVIDAVGVQPKFVELSLPDGNAWSGVRLKLVPGDKALEVQIIPQVALLEIATGRWIRLTLTEIDQGALAARPDLHRSQIRIHAASSEEGDQVLSRLRAHGIDFKKTGDLEPPTDILRSKEVLVEFTYTINRTMRRCVAKYAFNYLTFSAGVEFVLGPDFDITRRFIRFGDMPSFPLVKEEFRAILRDDSPESRQTNGHLVTVVSFRQGCVTEG